MAEPTAEERLTALAHMRALREHRNEDPGVNAAMNSLRRKVILRALFEVAPCPDSTEDGRACRYCEADAVVAALDGMEVPR